MAAKLETYLRPTTPTHRTPTTRAQPRKRRALDPGSAAKGPIPDHSVSFRLARSSTVNSSWTGTDQRPSWSRPKMMISRPAAVSRTNPNSSPSRRISTLSSSISGGPVMSITLATSSSQRDGSVFKLGPPIIRSTYSVRKNQTCPDSLTPHAVPQRTAAKAPRTLRPARLPQPQRGDSINPNPQCGTYCAQPQSEYRVSRNISRRMRAVTIAPAHIAQGSMVT